MRQQNAVSVAAVLVGCLAFAGRAHGQSEPAGVSKSYGTTSSETSLVMDAHDFVPDVPTTMYATDVTGSRYITSGSGSLLAPLRLPTGSRILGIEVQGCDTSTVGSLNFVLTEIVNSHPATELHHASGLTSAAGTPGCSRFLATLGTPLVVDNGARTYFIHGFLGSDTTLQFSSVRVFYKLKDE